MAGRKQQRRPAPVPVASVSCRSLPDWPLLAAAGRGYRADVRVAPTQQAQATGERERPAPVTAPLARAELQRLTREMGNRGVGRLVARARNGEDVIPSGLAHPSVASMLATSRGERALARAVSSRASRAEGRALTEDPLEEIEGRDPRPHRPPVRALQRLKINQVALTSGACGQRDVKWTFQLDSPAPEDGYIVQHVEGSEDIAACPGPRSGTMRKTLDFWEAWSVDRGATLEWMQAAGRFTFTDGSTRGATPSRVGVQSTDGTVKFFGKSTTGDLGKDGVAPADPASAWGPGKVPTSGDLPSTPTKPSWWDSTPIEGPAARQARSEWNCCGSDASRHTSTVTAAPAPAAPAPAPAPAKKWWQFWKWF